MTDDNYIGIQASDDPKDLPVSAWQRVQWLHMQGDEVGLLSFVQRLYRDAFLNGHISSDQAAGWVSPEEAKAREAAARREALLEVRAEIDSRIEGARGIHLRNWAVEAKVKRVEALADKWDADPIELALAGMNARHDLRAALAEPERDEEGGR